MNQLSQVSYRGLFITIQEGDISTIQLRYGPNDNDCVSLVEIPATSRVEVSVNDASLNSIKAKALVNALQVALALLPDFYLIVSMKERYFNAAA